MNKLTDGGKKKYEKKEERKHENIKKGRRKK